MLVVLHLEKDALEYLRVHKRGLQLIAIIIRRGVILRSEGCRSVVLITLLDGLSQIIADWLNLFVHVLDFGPRHSPRFVSLDVATENVDAIDLRHGMDLRDQLSAQRTRADDKDLLVNDITNEFRTRIWLVEHFDIVDYSTQPFQRVADSRPGISRR